MKIIYEDNHVIVVYKERGILAQADGSDKLDILNMTKSYLKEKYQKPGNVYLGLVHRLDINTEGLMVFAKTSKAAKRLSEDIKLHNFNKFYLALVEGKTSNGILENKLIKDENKKKSFISNEGKIAKLSYKTLKNININNTLCSIVDITLETGRFHQIRCQFANIGHPLYGDIKYGSKNNYRYANLQAYKLEFIHPTTKELLSFKVIDYNDYFKDLEGII